MDRVDPEADHSRRGRLEVVWRGRPACAQGGQLGDEGLVLALGATSTRVSTIQQLRCRSADHRAPVRALLEKSTTH